jgi:hypothetical protein
VAPNSPLRPAVIARAPEAIGPEMGSKPANTAMEAAADDPSETIRCSPARYLCSPRPWGSPPSLGAGAKIRSRRIFPLSCPICGGEMRIIAFITEAVDVRRILEHTCREPVERSASPPLRPGSPPHGDRRSGTKTPQRTPSTPRCASQAIPSPSRSRSTSTTNG